MAGEHAGRSLIEILWEQLDVQYANLMSIIDEGKHWPESEFEDASLTVAELRELAKHRELKGKVAGLAYAIAKITNPYADIKTQMELIREEAADRYEAEYEEEEDDDADL